jgi:hypothetical protein
MFTVRYSDEQVINRGSYAPRGNAGVSGGGR